MNGTTTPRLETSPLWRPTRAALLALLAAVLAGAMPTPARAQSRYSTSEARQLLERGADLERKAEQKGDDDYLDDALDAYHEAIELDPTLAEAYARLGILLYLQKRSDEAVKILREGLKRTSGAVEVKHALGINLYQVGQEDEAAGLLGEVVQTRNDLPDALFVLGKYHLERQDDAAALDFFERYRLLAPEDPQVYRALATIHLRQANLDAAQAALEQVIAIDPADVAGYINLGHVFYADSRYPDAVRSYETALTLDARREDVRYDLASVHFVAGEFDAALADFDRVLAANAHHVGAAYFRAECLQRLGRREEARQALLALVDLKPGYTYGYLKLAELALDSDDAAAAEGWLAKAQDQKDEHPDNLAMLGIILRRLGRTDEAVRQHTRLIELQPNVARNRLLLGMDFMSAGRYGEALESLEIAADRDPASQPTWQALSAALLYRASELADTGQLDAAEALLGRAAELDIHPVEARVNLAVIALRRDDIESARRHIADARALNADAPAVRRLAARLDVRDRRYKEAIDSLEALAQTEGSAQMTGASWHDLAVAYAAQNEWESAWKALEKARDLGVVAPRNEALIAFRLAVEHARKLRWKQAEDLLKEAETHAETLTRLERLRIDYAQSITAIKAERFSGAVRRLEALREAMEQLDRKDRKFVAMGGPQELDLELAYARYRSGRAGDALDLLTGGKKPKLKGDAAALESAIHEQLGADAYRRGDLDEALKHLERVSKAEESTASQLNLAAVRYRKGQTDAAGKIFEKLAAKGVTEAIYNYAVYLDEVRKDPAAAARYFRKYIQTGASNADEIEKMLEVKQRVYGIGGGDDAM